MTKGLFDRLQGELKAREQSPGLRMSDLLAFPEPVCGLLNWMIRQAQVSLAEIGPWLGKDETEAHEIMRELLGKGLVREIEIRGVTTYRVRLAPKRGKTMPVNLWQALENKAEPEEVRGNQEFY